MNRISIAGGSTGAVQIREKTVGKVCRKTTEKAFKKTSQKGLQKDCRKRLVKVRRCQPDKSEFKFGRMYAPETFIWKFRGNAVKIERTLCPYCGATLKVLPRQEVVECEYCGSPVLISWMGDGGSNSGAAGKPYASPDPAANRGPGSVPGQNAAACRGPGSVPGQNAAANRGTGSGTFSNGKAGRPGMPGGGAGAAPGAAPGAGNGRPAAGNNPGAGFGPAGLFTRPLLPPPGFRNKNIAHMIMGTIGYLMIISIAVALDSPLDTIFFAIACLTVVDICTEWTGAFNKLAGVTSTSTALRFFAKTGWSFLFFLAWIVLMAIVEGMLY